MMKLVYSLHNFRKCALEGIADAQANILSPSSVTPSAPSLTDDIPSAPPPSYDDVLREDLQKSFFESEFRHFSNLVC